ncbi:ABC transporter permease [Oerskovia merdavium]|uniref:ABC3 transporter permease C-terminal domain-containing protein n=1 Tax=Oerskovia merdavium TaxID=2762227 RepID=A0ABR8U3W6_9CELL|nr:FtsX-like permease family protein [Oerskovia merdavium]MBD7982733.1 hypothetical protein [Oerskovia merdavium]
MPTLLVVLLVAAMCLTTVLTVGRTSAAQAQVQGRLESAGARLLTVTDTRDQGLFGAAVVGSVAALDSVTGAAALTSPRDVTATNQGQGGVKIPLWAVVGDPDSLVELESGRWPRPGEALISSALVDVLGFTSSTGSVDAGSRQWAVVGTFRTRGAVPELESGVVAAATTADVARTLYVTSEPGRDVARVQQIALSIVAPAALNDVSVQAPDILAGLQDSVGEDLGTFAGNLLLIVLSGGAVLTVMVVSADVLVRRSDLGRRRALGASRQAVALLIMTQTAAAAGTGAILGTAIGALAGATWATTPPAVFLIGTATLSLLAATIASIPPALAAARADPVRVLRTP